VPAGSSGVGQQRREPLHPPVDGDAVNLDAALGEQFLWHCCIEPEGGTKTQQSGGSSSWEGAKKGSNGSIVRMICRV
jgi:hypothetical protein